MALDTKFIATLAEQTLELQEASEHLLRQIAAGNLEKDDVSFSVVANALGWDAKRRRDEITRMGNVLKHERNACSDDEFARRIELADGLKKTNAAKRSKLEEKIAALRSEIVELDKAEKDAERAVSDAEIARAKLRELVPSHVRASVDREISRLHSQEENQRRLRLESEIRVFEAIIRNEIHPNQQADLCKMRFPEALRGDQYGRAYVPPDQWQLIRERAVNTLAELKAEYEQLDSHIRAEEESILGGLDFYITKD